MINGIDLRPMTPVEVMAHETPTVTYRPSYRGHPIALIRWPLASRVDGSTEVAEVVVSYRRVYRNRVGVGLFAATAHRAQVRTGGGAEVTKYSPLDSIALRDKTVKRYSRGQHEVFVREIVDAVKAGEFAFASSRWDRDVPA